MIIVRLSGHPLVQDSLRDHKHKMMTAISYHLYRLDVMFILYASYFALIDGSKGVLD